MRTRIFILTLAAVFCVSGGLQGQESSAQGLEHELRAMIADTVSAQPDHEVVRDFLDRADVGAAVAAHGLDLERMKGAVGTLEGKAVADLARQVRALDDEDQVGGNTIVVSSTAVIIALLILILISQ
jgi:hypothetical protein